MVGIDANAGSFLMAATRPRGSVRGLLRSRMTSAGAAFRISASAASGDRANITDIPSWFAVVRILDVNIKSSRSARIMDVAAWDDVASGFTTGP